MGSGCATQTDVDWVWQEVQSQVIRDMAFQDNVRTDGRGLIDSRAASFQVQGHAMSSPAALIHTGRAVFLGLLQSCVLRPA